MCRGTRRIVRDRCASLCSAHPTYKIPHLPYAAPSIGAFIGNSPLGVRQGCRTVAGGTRKSLPATPGKCEKRRKQEASGRLFFGYFLLWKNAPAFSTFTTSMWFGEAKRKCLARGCENPHSNNRRVSDTLYTPHPNPFPQGERGCFLQPLFIYSLLSNLQIRFRQFHLRPIAVWLLRSLRLWRSK